MSRDYKALVAYLNRTSQYRFSFERGEGQHDCVRFADGAIRAQFGIGVIGRLSWNSERSAVRVLAKQGGIEAAVDRRLRPIPSGMAKRGDIGLLPPGNFQAAGDVGLCVIEGEFVVAPGVDRLVRLPRRLMVKAWDASAPI